MPSQPTATAAGAGVTSPCCETGRVVADPVTGQPVCSCQYESSRLAALNSYPRLSTGSSLYGAAAAASYPAGEQAPYPSIGVDSSYFSSFVSTDMPHWTQRMSEPSDENNSLIAMRPIFFFTA